MKRTMLAGLAILALVGACTDEQTAKRVLEEQGYSEVRTTGWAWLSCGKDDTFKTGFVARSPKGNKVEGAVCSGWFKGATVRLD